MISLLHGILMGVPPPDVDEVAPRELSEKTDTNDGMIVAIVLATVAGLICVLVLCYWVMTSMRGGNTRRPMQPQQTYQQQQQNSMNDGMGTPSFLFNASLEKQELPLLLMKSSKR